MRSKLGIIALIIYTLIFKHFPKTSTPIIGTACKKIRGLCIRFIFKKCGKNLNIEKGAHFGYGDEIEIGDNSGIGINCKVTYNIKIGNNVIMGPEVLIYGENHLIDDPEIPMNTRTSYRHNKLVIEDNVWIGTRVIILPSVNRICTGSIIGAGAVVTKDVPPYAVVAGNPARIVKMRK